MKKTMTVTAKLIALSIVIHLMEQSHGAASISYVNQAGSSNANALRQLANE